MAHSEDRRYPLDCSGTAQYVRTLLEPGNSPIAVSSSGSSPGPSLLWFCRFYAVGLCLPTLYLLALAQDLIPSCAPISSGISGNVEKVGWKKQLGGILRYLCQSMIYTYVYFVHFPPSIDSLCWDHKLHFESLRTVI